MAASARSNPFVQKIMESWVPDDSGSGCCQIEVGLSGGADSVVLTHLLSSLRSELNFRLKAVYVHHGLSSNADSWAEFCRRFCASLDIPFRVARVQLDHASGLGVEAEARKRRYEVYAASDADVIALAHHYDDLSETVLMNLLRGGGPHSLAAMPLWRSFEGKHLWRPLLHMTKAEILAYAEAHDLAFVEDESNSDPRYRRNWLRRAIFPQLHQAVPHLYQHLQRSAELMQDAVAILDEVAEQDLNAILRYGYFDCVVWRRLSEPRRKQALLRYVMQNYLGAPRPESLIDFSGQLMLADAGDEIRWQLPDGLVYAYQNRLFLCLHEPVPFEPVRITGLDRMAFANGVLYWQQHDYGLPEALIKDGLVLKFRTGGEALALNVGHKSVKKILHETKDPPFLRRHWPLLFHHNGACLAIVNHCVSVDYGCKGGYLPCWSVAGVDCILYPEGTNFEDSGLKDRSK